MNIFVLDLNVKKCAAYHCDRHCTKMVLESAQMLSTSCRLSGQNVGYKACYQNHPCSLWVRESLDNWRWLRSLVICLNYEWKIRFNHSCNHKSYDVVMSLPEPHIHSIGLTTFAQAMPDIYKDVNAVKAYRNYYLGEKRKIVTWKNGQPYWWR